MRGSRPQALNIGRIYRFVALVVPPLWNEVAVVVPPFWNELPPELRQLPDPSYALTKTPPLAISAQVFHANREAFLDHKSCPDSTYSP